jgi:hypothetical protein
MTSFMQAVAPPGGAAPASSEEREPEPEEEPEGSEDGGSSEAIERLREQVAALAAELERMREERD